MFTNFTQNSNPFTQNWQQQFKKNDILSQIIGINVFVFLLVTVSSIFFWLARFHHNVLLHGLAVHANTNLLLKQPWGIFTYMITHQGFFHLLFNMLWLFWIGKLFISRFGEKKLLWLYIAGGIGGAILYTLAYNNLEVFDSANQNAFAIGASASIMALFFAVITYDPQHSIFLLFIGRVKMLHIAIAIIIIDLLLLPKGNAGGHISHIGGALIGVGFTLIYKGFPKLGKKTKSQHNYKYSKDQTYNAAKNHKKDEINTILDKISKSGYESLTTEERKKLFKSSHKVQ